MGSEESSRLNGHSETHGAVGERNTLAPAKGGPIEALSDMDEMQLPPLGS